MFIYCLPIINSLWQDTEIHLLPFVSPERQKTVLKYYHPIDRKLSLYAALLARMQLSFLTGIPNNALLFQRNYYGKPILLSNPRYHFSFSHTHNMIVCTVSDKAPIGIDVEFINKNLSIKYMYEGLHPMEIQYINDTASDSQHLNFYKIWTQKEAYVKYLGTGFSTNASTINTLDSSISSHCFTWKYQKYICSAYTPFDEQEISISFFTETDIQKNYFQ